METSGVHYGIFQDWKANRGNIKAQLVLAMFRLATLIRNNKILIVFFFWYLIFYRFFVEWVLGIELPWSLRAGRGLRFQHGQALVVHGDSIIGENCGLKHSTTIGNRMNPDGSISRAPRLGNNVDIGAHVCIIGDIEIGDNVIIGAGSIVVKSVPSNSIVVGNPARVIRENVVCTNISTQ
ncbi:serine acetyltransferase [Nibrella saemangeumensis]|uniref:serine acetyltransferase n=1 Tax=Nibrella saemangeumensis TaxID=1084526 RepID=UPI0031E5C5D8